MPNSSTISSIFKKLPFISTWAAQDYNNHNATHKELDDFAKLPLCKIKQLTQDCTLEEQANIYSEQLNRYINFVNQNKAFPSIEDEEPCDILSFSNHLKNILRQDISLTEKQTKSIYKEILTLELTVEHYLSSQEKPLTTKLDEAFEYFKDEYDSSGRASLAYDCVRNMDDFAPPVTSPITSQLMGGI